MRCPVGTQRRTAPEKGDRVGMAAPQCLFWRLVLSTRSAPGLDPGAVLVGDGRIQGSGRTREKGRGVLRDRAGSVLWTRGKNPKRT